MARQTEAAAARLHRCSIASPLLGPCGLTKAAVAEALPLWQRKGLEIATNLGLGCDSFESMSPVHQRRIYQYYLPVYFWLRLQLMAHRNQTDKQGPLIVGISAPQGCGKSTLCEQVEALFASEGFTAASISTDDFYLTRDQQIAVASANPGNPLLEMRGNAGTHDLELGSRTLSALKGAQTRESMVSLPRYDKSAYQGKGDRAPASSWPQLQGPVDIVLFEGWGLGFSPIGATAAAAVDPHLVPVDAALEKYKAAWDDAVDVWFVVKVGDPEYAYKWRLQAERAMRNKGKPAMTDEQVVAFVDRFMPAYRAYLPGLYSQGPTTGGGGRVLVVEVDANREPVAQQPAPIA